MADDSYESELILTGDSRGAEKALDSVIKKQRDAEKQTRALSAAGKKASADYAGAVTDASRQIETANKRAEDSLKRLIATQKQAKPARGGISTGDLKSGAGEIAREVAQGSPLAPVLEGVASFTPVGIAAGIAAAGAAAALGQLQASLEKSREAAKQATERILENARTQDEINKLLTTGQYDAAQQAAIAELEKQTALQKEVQLLEQRRAELQAQYDQSDLIGKLDFRGKIDDAVKSLEEKQVALQGQSEKTAAAYAALNTELGTSAKVAEQYNAAVTAFVEKDKERQAAEAALATTMASLIEQENALNQAYTRGVLARSLARGKQDSRASEDRDIAAERAQEDLDAALEQQATAHQENMLAIAERGQNAIADAQAAIVERQKQAAAQILALQTQYRDDTLAAESAFNRDRARALEDYQLQVARAAEDLRDNLRKLREERDRAKASAILDNDVVAFLEAQSAFETSRRDTRRDARKESRRGSEDFNLDDSRAREDFAREQAERQAAHEARLVEIQRELAEYITAQNTKIAQIEAQTAQELELAQRAYEEQLRLDQEQRDLVNRRADEDLQRSLTRLKQDREAEDAAACIAHTEALGRIDTQRDAAVAAYDVLLAKTEELRQKALSLSFGGAGSAPSIPVPSSSGTPYIPTPGSEKFYEDPRQAPGGKSSGGLGGISSASGAASAAPVINVQTRIMESGGMQFVPYEDMLTLIETITTALRTDQPNL